LPRLPHSKISQEYKNMFTNEPHSRRAFLRRSGQLALSSSALPFALNLAAMGEAAAFNAPGDYKALVCVYMGGGNDYGNTVIPVDAPNYARYSAIRGPIGGAAGIAIANSALTSTTLAPTVAPVDLQGAARQYALHPSMTGLTNLFNAGRMAVQLNVGPLIEPLSRTEYENRSRRRPPQLMSHDDQTSLWQSPNSVVPKFGWGGNTNTLMQASGVNSADGALFTCISVSGGGGVFLSGANVKYSVDRNRGAIPIAATGSPFGLAAVGAALRGTPGMNNGLLTQTIGGGHKLENEYSTVTSRAVSAETKVKEALEDPALVASFNALGVTFPNDGLGQQLRMVARLIHGRSKLGVATGRQIFFVDIGGFDTHDNILVQHPRILGSLSAAMTAFYNATVAMTMQNNVTSFTASDFGRALAYNGTGTDHGWGSHHFVVGGAVDGRKFFGTPPPVSVSNLRTGGNGTPYTPDSEWHVGDGRLVPSTSVDQYAATLAKWFGVTDAEMPTIFPNINNFGVTFKGITYAKNMGFMG
jgi:uncharacterized protein (DUF1501 family)